MRQKKKSFFIPVAVVQTFFPIHRATKLFIVYRKFNFPIVDEMALWDGSETTRVQVTLRGQRFESTVGVLGSFCRLFRTFFRTLRVHADQDAKACLTSSFSSTAAAPLREVFFRDGAWFIDFTVRKDEAPSEEDLSMELQNEFAGALFVYMRKLHAAGFGISLQEQSDSDALSSVTQQQGLEKGVKWASRWNEMGYEQQRGLAAVINTFGLEALQKEGFGKPSAEPALETAADEKADGGMTALAMQYAANKQREAIMNDDFLEMPAQGCATCGTSGHDTASCPYGKGQ